MKTLFPTPKTINEARRQANIIIRAKTLFDSYTFRLVEGTEAFPMYFVKSPEGRVNVVDLPLDHCTCESFREDKDCKHRIALAERIADDEMCAQYDADMAACEDEETGCDYRY